MDIIGIKKWSYRSDGIATSLPFKVIMTDKPTHQPTNWVHREITLVQGVHEHPVVNVAYRDDCPS